MSEIRTSDKRQDLLTGRGYRQVPFDGLNDFYPAEEHSELESRPARPPYVFDEFELAAVAQERQAREELQRSRYDLNATSESLRSQVSRREIELATMGDELAHARYEITRLGQNLS